MLWLVFGTLCPCAAISQTWCSAGPRPSRTGSGDASEKVTGERKPCGGKPSGLRRIISHESHLAVRVDARVDEPLQYELGELVLQGRYCSVEGLGHLGHVRRDVGAEILKGRSTF